ncbi:MAG: 50S ribosomal protein L23 [Bacilli bacterium]
MKNYDIILRPIVTEKSMSLIEKHQYTFAVKPGSNKVQVKNAVAELFNVTVQSVNMMNCQRKTRHVGKYTGLRPAVQKAIVTVADTDKIDIFEI